MATHPILVKLDFEITKNVAEYDDCIICLQVTVEIGVENLRVYRDSNVIINQTS